MNLNIHQAKIRMRAEIKNRLSAMTKDSVIQQSNNICDQLLQSDYYKSSKRIGVYVSLPAEVQTYNIIQNMFANGKECFIPRYIKEEMTMVKINSMADLESLPTTKWNIKQPLPTEQREEANGRGGVDLMIVPGVGFTKAGHRLGHGKGYYDKYLFQMVKHRLGCSLPPTFCVGLAFTQQICQQLPVTENDFKLDSVLYPI